MTPEKITTPLTRPATPISKRSDPHFPAVSAADEIDAVEVRPVSKDDPSNESAQQNARDLASPDPAPQDGT
jgi:hypothetical protein